MECEGLPVPVDEFTDKQVMGGMYENGTHSGEFLSSR